jgi:hypothetical protein
LNIAGATSNTLTVAYASPYYDNDSSVKFRCVVNGIKGAITQISKIQLQKSETAGYRGVQRQATKEEIDVPSPQIGDVVLLDNTENENAGIYGEAHVYDGEKWVSTEESDALAMTYKDALELAELSEKTIYASEIYASLIVTKRLRVQSGDFLAKINETDGVDVTMGGKVLFKVEPLTGKIYFGEHFWYTPADGTIHTPNDKTVIKADGTIEAVDGKFTGDVFADSGYFKGIFDTTALKLEPWNKTVGGTITVPNNYNQGKDILEYFFGTTLDQKYSPILRASLSGYPTVKYFRAGYHWGSDVFWEYHAYEVFFYDEAFSLVKRICTYTQSGTVDNAYKPAEKIDAEITVSKYIGGDRLIVSSDIPTEATGLANYQLYLSGDTLKVKLP